MPALKYFKSITQIAQTCKVALLSRGSLTILSLAILAMIYSIQLGFIVISIALCYSILRNVLNRLGFNTVVTQSFITLTVYIIILQACVIAVWALYREFPLDKVVIVMTFGLLLTYLYRVALVQVEQPVTTRIPIADSRDVVSLIVALAIGILMVIPPMLITGTDLKSNLLGVINNSVDDANHAMMINDRIQFNRGVFHGIKAVDDNRIETLSFYPAGWHSANAIVIQSLKPDIQLGLPSLFAYGINKLFWFVILVFAFMRLIFYMYDKAFKQDRLGKWALVFVSTAGVIGSYWVLVDIFNIGFYSFFPQLISVILFAIVIIHSDNLDDKSQYEAIALLAMLAIGGSLSWILVLPILAVALLCYLYIHTPGRSSKTRLYNSLRFLIASFLRHLPLYLLIVVAVLLQLYIMSRSSHSVPFIEAISMTGRISIYNQAAVLVLSFGLILFFVLTKTAQKSAQALSGFLAISAVFCFALYMLQITNVYEPRYYFYKALYVFIVVAVPMAIIGFLGLLLKIRTTSSHTTMIFCSILVVVGTIYMISPNPSAEPTYQYIRGIRPLSPVDNKSIYNELAVNTLPRYYDKTATIYFDENRQLHDNLSNLLVRTNKKANDCFYAMRAKVEELSFSKQQEPMDEMMKPARHYCFENGYTLRLIVDDASLERYQKAINTMGLSHSVNLTSITASAEQRQL